MFAFDFDSDPSLFEDFSIDFPADALTTGSRRFLAKPSTYSEDGAPHPDTMSQYRCAAATDEHINATILGHAFYLFAAKVGHEKAGNVLTYIPFALPAAPSFNDVAFWFIQRSNELYGPTERDAAINAFRTQAGIGTQTPGGNGCPRYRTPPRPSPPSP
jgi:Zn-dependent metalloprotease